MGVVPVLPVFPVFPDLRDEGFQNAGRRGRLGERIMSRARFVTPTKGPCVTHPHLLWLCVCVCDARLVWGKRGRRLRLLMVVNNTEQCDRSSNAIRRADIDGTWWGGRDPMRDARSLLVTPSTTRGMTWMESTRLGFPPHHETPRHANNVMQAC